MEREKTVRLLCLLVVLLQVGEGVGCPSRLHENLECFNDFNNIITCVWNSSEHRDRLCTVYAKDKESNLRSSCKLTPADASGSAQRKCSMTFSDVYVFTPFDTYSITIRCESLNESVISIDYEIPCFIKLYPPGRPQVNFTSISWSAEEPRNPSFKVYDFELQWKQCTESWNDATTILQNDIQCTSDCQAQLYEEQLVKDESYDMRVRVKLHDEDYQHAWSDWSPTASWVSPIGKTVQRQPTYPDPWNNPLIIGGAGVVLAICLIVIFFRTKKNTWVYIVKKIKGPPIPDPEKFFQRNGNFQAWLSPQFTSESLHAFLKPVDIVSVEVTNVLDAITPSWPEDALLEKKRWDNSCQSGNSSYSNPSYSKLCPAPLSSLTSGTLEACAPDSSYGPAVGKKEGIKEGMDREEKQREDLEILQLLSKASESGETMQMSSDYERVEKPQAERCRLHSSDSGMGSFEEEQVSEESLEEADSISMTDVHGQQQEGMEEMKGNEADLRRLLGDMSCGGGFSKGSIQVCSDYERVEKLQAERCGLMSPDSGIGSKGEEQVSQESLEDVDGPMTSEAFWFPPSSAFRCALPSFTTLPLNFSSPGLGSVPGPLPGHVLEELALTASTGPIEPSGGGYMPVKGAQA
ncbi:interleukin-2 receptor subunit beta isoform X2 [Myripristis murdjan]|uniref:interleukin-2 receptor subunit beta isoform X2 n=1 Tax=Myripristis murdjan TaxID=586833 RepID=UPI0011762851|nr:interleukin-2 receptor subunit beta-like isoform X2 [Myripristis murdjan]